MQTDRLGRLVREAWIAYCVETGDGKPSHIAPWESLSAWEQEADRRIGVAVAAHYAPAIAAGHAIVETWDTWMATIAPNRPTVRDLDALIDTLRVAVEATGRERE